MEFRFDKWTMHNVTAWPRGLHPCDTVEVILKNGHVLPPMRADDLSWESEAGCVAFYIVKKPHGLVILDEVASLEREPDGEDA